MDNYKMLLGIELDRFLNGIVSFEDFQDNISRDIDSSNFEYDEITKQIFHAIYQYETDILVGDEQYVDGIKNTMKKIAKALMDQDEDNLSLYVTKYFKNPI